MLLSAVMLLGGCAKQEIDGNGGGKLDLSKTAPVELKTIRLTDGGADAAPQSRAGGETPMPVGATFRLYAFEKGRTAIEELITSRTYTITNNAGTALMDADQPDLYLPLGDVDIYLVGPVTAYVGGNLTDIAGAGGVNPHRGIDLVASKTPVEIIAGENSLTLAALEHRMTKAEVVVATNSDGVYENLVLEKATIASQAATSTFAFGENGGTIAPATGTEVYTMPTPQNITTTGGLPTWSCTEYLIPQPQKDFKIEVEFTCNQKASGEEAAGSTLKYRQSGFASATMTGGTHQRFTAMPLTPIDIIWRLSILPWVDEAGPDVPTGNPDLLFDFRGTDAPITIGTKQYWPDRSGNGNHAELTGTMKYHPTGKYYYQEGAKGAGKLLLPDNLDATTSTGFTYEVLFTSDSPTVNEGMPVHLSSNGKYRDFTVFMPYKDNSIYFDTGGDATGEATFASRLAYNTSDAGDKDLMKVMQTYTFRLDKANKEMKIFRNGKTLATNTDKPGVMPVAFTKNTMWSNATSGMCLYSARMYRRKLSDAEVAAGAAADKATYTGIAQNTDYVQGGLVLDLRGDDGGPKTTTYAGRSITYWQDNSKAANHAEIIGGIGQAGTITYDATEKKYTFPGKKTNYMRLINTLGKTNDFTLELVAKGKDTEAALIYFSYTGADGSDNSRQVLVHFPYVNTFYFSSPNLERIVVPVANLPYPITTAPQQGSFTRRHGVSNGIQAFINGAPVGSPARGNTPLRELSYCLIGAQVTPQGGGAGQPFTGEVYAIRFYNRALTEQEMRHNYMIDKDKYNLNK